MKTWQKVAVVGGAVGSFVAGWVLRCVLSSCPTCSGPVPSITATLESGGVAAVGGCVDRAQPWVSVYTSPGSGPTPQQVYAQQGQGYTPDSIVAVATLAPGAQTFYHFTPSASTWVQVGQGRIGTAPTEWSKAVLVG